MVQKQEALSPAPSIFLSGATPTKPDTSIFSFRDKVFMHTMSLIDDDSNGIRDMLQANGIYTLLEILSIPFKDIEDIE